MLDIGLILVGYGGKLHMERLKNMQYEEDLWINSIIPFLKLKEPQIKLFLGYYALSFQMP